MSTTVHIRRATETDLDRIIAINVMVFNGDRDHPEGAAAWVRAWFGAFPLYQYFVAEIDGVVVGYSGWQVHGGFHRPDPVIELDQHGVDPAYKGHGVASKLLHDAMHAIARWMRETNDRIESHISFVVWVYSFNFNAISVYVKEFGDGIEGLRKQFGDRAESMLRRRIPLVMIERHDE